MEKQEMTNISKRKADITGNVQCYEKQEMIWKYFEL